MPNKLDLILHNLGVAEHQIYHTENPSPLECLVLFPLKEGNNPLGHFRILCCIFDEPISSPPVEKISSDSLWWDSQGLEGKGGRFISQVREHEPFNPLIDCCSKNVPPNSHDVLYIVLVIQVDLAAYTGLSRMQLICIYWALSCFQLDICNTNLHIFLQTSCFYVIKQFSWSNWD